MTKRYTDLFVDFDDTIYDTRGNAQIALSELFEKMSLGQYFAKEEDFTVPYWETNHLLWSQYSKGEIDRDYLMVERFRRPLALGKGLEPDREYCLHVSDIFLDLCSVKPGLVEGARELLDYLATKYRLHLCSNGFHEVQFRKLRASDTEKYFSNVILSEDAGVNKPHPDFFAYALSKTAAPRETTIMIGDNFDTDISGAMAAGIDQLYYNRWQKADAHSKGATMVADSLAEIATML